VLVIKRIRVQYRLKDCPDDKRATAERAHDHHAKRCPVHQSIGACIPMTTTLEFV
jgi:uncharacterized OsmC-like protein